MRSSATLYIMQRAAEKAAFSLSRDFGELEKLQVSHKGFRNFVTSADRNSEARIVQELTHARPDYSLVCEESGFTEKEDKNSVWIVDPIDGTSNFMRGIPYFAINIALRVNNEFTAGVTLDPVRGECYKAELGQGAFVGQRNRLRVSGRENLKEAVVATRVSLDLDEKLIKAGVILRKTGSIALDLAYLSAGKYDIVVAHGACLWDIAAGMVLVKESGGFIRVNSSGEYYNMIAASSKKLLDSCINLGL